MGWDDPKISSKREILSAFSLLQHFAALQVIQISYAVKCTAFNPYLGRELSPVVILTV